MKKQIIPEGFLWGGAVAAHQLEGGMTSKEREFRLQML